MLVLGQMSWRRIVNFTQRIMHYSSMKVNTRLICFLVFTSLLGTYDAISQCCTHYIQMFDVFGDGWEGSQVTVYINGIDIGSETVTATYNEFSFDACDGDNIQISYQSGGGFFENEISFVLEVNGWPLFQSGSPPSSGIIYTTIANCNFSPSCPESTLFTSVPSCLGNCNGSIEVTVTSNVAGPYDFTIIDNSTNNIVSAALNQNATYTYSNLCAGFYLLEVNDVNDCLITNSFSVADGPNNSSSSNETLTICEGQVATINGIDYSTAQDVVNVYTSALGCDSIVTSTIVVNSNITSNETLTICEGQVATINGIDYSTAQDVVNVYTSALGCDSIVTSTIVVNSNITSNETLTICEGQVATINGIDYSTAQDVVNVYTSALGCDSIVTSTIVVNSNITSNETLTICEGQVATINGIDYSTAQDVVNVYTSALGCDSIVTSTIVVNSNITSNETLTICEGQVATINGIDYSTAQDVVNVYTSALGCDSIVTSTIVVNSNITSNETLTICEGQVATINGIDYSTAQDVVNVYTSALGCDSIVTSTIVVNSNITSNETLTICEGQVATINGIDYSTAQDVVNVYTSALGCDSIVTSTIVVNSNITSNETLTICEGQVATINGIDYSTAQDVVNVYTSALGCDSIVTSTIVVNSNITSNETLTICEGQVATINGIDYSTAQDVVNVYTSALGCDSIVTSTIVVNSNITSNETLTICEGQVATINGIDYSTAQDVVNVYTSALGCDSIVTSTIVVNSNITSNETLTICEGQVATINGIDYSTAQDVVNVYTSALGCDSIVTSTIVVNSNITSNETLTICEGQVATINGIDYSTAQDVVNVYTSALGCDSIVTSTIVVATMVTVDINQIVCEGQPLPPLGDYFDEPNNRFIDSLQTSLGCDSIVYTNLNYLDPNTILPDQVILCEGQSFIAEIDGLGEFFSIYWSTGNSDDSETFTEEGVYSVSLNSSMCNASDSIEIVVQFPLESTFEEYEICTDETLTLQLPQDNGQITWQDGTEDSFLHVSESGNYTAQCENACGTYHHYTANVTERDCSCNIYVPSAITPNADNLNDVFAMKHYCDFIDYELLIYNSWGELVFRTTDPNESWNASYVKSDHYIQYGVYNYLITYSSVDSLKRVSGNKIHGTVTVIR